MARFAQYAMVASEEALIDASWLPKKEDDLEATVRPLVRFRHSLLNMNRVSIWDQALAISMMSTTLPLHSRKAYVSFAISGSSS
jgi:3-oxoacyl-(acyl-carrier-protein) synthase